MRRSPERPATGRPSRPRGVAHAPTRLEVVILGVDAAGRGVFDAGRGTATVDGALPGERVEVAVEPGSPTARLLRILAPSPHRVTPRCRHFEECGGCTWQHVTYPEQLRLKRQIVQSALDRELGRGRVRVSPVRGLGGGDAADMPWGFRHKVHFALAQAGGSRVVMGHMTAGTRRVFDATECPVHAARGNDVAFAVKAALQRAAVPAGEPPRGIVRHVVSRVGRSSGEVVTTLVVTENVSALRRVSRDVLAAARPDGWHLNLHRRPGPMLFGADTRHLAGRERVREDVGGVSFLVSPTSFFQTNVEAADLLAREVLAAVPAEAGDVLDLYAGLGFFSLPLAKRGHRVTAVEENPAAVADGEASARFNRIPSAACRFIRAAAEDALARFAKQATPFGAVVLDPPRAGASDAVLDALRAHLRPERIVYVSCEPGALARDLARLASGDGACYRAMAVTPIDMFPHTAHVETVAVLAREGGRR